MRIVKSPRGSECGKMPHMGRPCRKASRSGWTKVAPTRPGPELCQNCARNRGSFSNSTRMSGIPYRSMATRSTPRPNAKPV